MTDEQTEDKPKKKPGRPKGSRDTNPRSRRSNTDTKSYLKNLKLHSGRHYVQDENGVCILDAEGRRIPKISFNTAWDRTSLVVFLFELIDIARRDENMKTRRLLFSNMNIRKCSYNYFSSKVLPKFKDDVEIDELLDTLDDVIYNNIFKSEPDFRKFLLKTKHNEEFQERQVVEHNSNTNILIAGNDSLQYLQNLKEQYQLSSGNDIIDVDQNADS